MTENIPPSMTRRDVVAGVSGLAALSMSDTTVTQAQEVLESGLESDPHTVDTYRSIVDAIVPRTPELEDDLGPEHVPGGLDVELEKFIIWDFNHFHEVRSEAVAPDGSVPADGEMPQSLFEVDLDTTAFESDLAALATLGDGGRSTPDLDLDADAAAVEETLDFGATDRVAVSFADLEANGEDVAEFELLVESDGQTHQEVLQNYPYANMFPYAFDLVAAEFLVRGENEDPPAPNEQFAGGGTYVRLSREDRLRCLWTIVDGGAADRLDDLLSPLLPAVGLLKFVVMAINGLHGFGYYTEWSGYGDTKTATPSERELQVDEGEVQSRRQTGYPGPADGYAADWRHVIPGGFTDQWDSGGGDRERSSDGSAGGIPGDATDAPAGDDR